MMEDKPTKARLYECLPHGSGIDLEWLIEETRRSFRCYNGFHCMDEHGFYEGWADFVLIVPKSDPLDFKLQFCGRRSQYLAKKHMLRDYLEDEFLFALGAEFPRTVADIPKNFTLVYNSQDIRALGVDPWEYPLVFFDPDTGKIYGIENNVAYLNLPVVRIK